jgi:hypothetical protein
MKAAISEIYLDQLLGKSTFEEAKVKLTEYAVKGLFSQEFDRLLSEPIIIEPEIGANISEWHDEFFIKEKNEIVEALIILPSWFGIKKDFIEYYNQLLIVNWHHEHESLIETIKNTKSNTSTTYIKKAILNNYKYLHFNDTNYASFIRKCMWALADINTEESNELLKSYLENENPVIRQYADEQIRWLNGDKNTRYMG